MTTSPPGYRSSGAYSGNGPWLSRSFTRGPEPKSYLSQLCAGTYPEDSVAEIGTATGAKTMVLNKSLRFIGSDLLFPWRFGAGSFYALSASRLASSGAAASDAGSLSYTTLQPSFNRCRTDAFAPPASLDHQGGESTAGSGVSDRAGSILSD